MINRLQKNWSDDIDAVIRSRHYTWLAMGLGGESVENAVTSLLTDIMHLCQRQGVPWEDVLDISREQFEQEENDVQS